MRCGGLSREGAVGDLGDHLGIVLGESRGGEILFRKWGLEAKGGGPQLCGCI